MLSFRFVKSATRVRLYNIGADTTSAYNHSMCYDSLKLALDSRRDI